MNIADRRRGRRTVDRIIFDAIGILPAWTDDRERRAGSAVEWSNGTKAIRWRLIDDKAQSTRTRL